MQALNQDASVNQQLQGSVRSGFGNSTSAAIKNRHQCFGIEGLLKATGSIQDVGALGGVFQSNAAEVTTELRARRSDNATGGWCGWGWFPSSHGLAKLRGSRFSLCRQGPIMAVTLNSISQEAARGVPSGLSGFRRLRDRVWLTGLPAAREPVTADPVRSTAWMNWRCRPSTVRTSHAPAAARAPRAGDQRCS